jgi:1-acyl-sn-glycerol-3-phosphate acyltransferase
MASQRQRAARPGGFVYGAIRAFTILVETLLTRPHIVGRERIPQTGGLLVVSNHASNADPVILLAVMPRPLSFMTKEELFRSLPVRAFLKLWRGAFPVRRGQADIAALRDALDLIREGHPVVLFPEGTRSPGALGPAHPGGAYLATRARCPVLPVAIIGSEAMQNIWCLRHRPRFEVHFGMPFVVPEHLGEPAAVLDMIMGRIAEMLPPERQGAYQRRSEVASVG